MLAAMHMNLLVLGIPFFYFFGLLNCQNQPAVSSIFSCESDGIFPNPYYCNSFIVCSNGIPHYEFCAMGLLFSTILNTCDWAKNVICRTAEVDINIEVIIAHGEEKSNISATEVPTQTAGSPIIDGLEQFHTKKPTEIHGQEAYEEKFTCPNKSGHFPHPTNCNQFYHCVHGKPSLQNCAENLYYNASLKTCDWPKNVNCSASIGVQFIENPYPDANGNIFRTDISNSQNKNFSREKLVCQTNDDYFPHPNNCSMFFKCINGTPEIFHCAEGLLYSYDKKHCNFPEEVKCFEGIERTFQNDLSTRATPKTNPKTVGTSPRRPDPLYPQPEVDAIAEECNRSKCRLPDCNCGGPRIPGNFSYLEVPQIVLITFDGAVNNLNEQLYAELFNGTLKNPNGCPISATFYVSHEWTDYSLVQNLYADGHEIASYSITSNIDENSDSNHWAREIDGQREILSGYAGVPMEDIRGMRAPNLVIGGNAMYHMLYEKNFTYDSSMPVYNNSPPSWPYTLDYKIFHKCMISPCPDKSYPGLWELPLIMWHSSERSGSCSTQSACTADTSQRVYDMLIENFIRHFSTSRAPFGLFYTSSWFLKPQQKEGFIKFLYQISERDDVWIITTWQAIQWIRYPHSLSNINSFKPFGCNHT